MYGLGRSNAASALTRKVRKALGARASTLTTKTLDMGRTPACELRSDELEITASARQVLQAAGFECTEIVRYSWGFTCYASAR